MKSVLSFAAIIALFSCQSVSPKQEPPKNATPTIPASTKAPAPVVTPEHPPEAPVVAPVAKPFEDPLPRRRDFLTANLGGAPGPALIGDFNGDGRTDVATQINTNLYVFTEIPEGVPTKWEVLDAVAPATVKDASWAIEKLPAMKGVIDEKQSVLVVGESDAPLLNFWYPKEASYAWLQVIPPALEATRAEAEKVHGPLFGLTKNNLYGQKGFDGEADLLQGFVGDFDSDGKQELIAVDNKNSTLSTYKIGAKPTKYKLSFTGTKAALYPNPKPTTIEVPFESEDFKGGTFTIKGDYFEIWLPEKAGVFLAQSKGKWKTLWVSD